MRILHVETGRHLYGGALQVRYLLEGLSARGVANVLVCPSGAAIAEASAVFCEAVHEVPMGGDLDLGFVGRLKRVIRETRPDLVHLHSRRGADVLGGIAARRVGVPVVLSRRVDNPEPALWARLKYRLFDRVITISEAIRQVLLAEGVPPERVVCVPSAVDMNAWQGTCDREGFQAACGLAPGERAVGVIAQLITRKGHRHLLTAAPAILAAHPEVRLLFFGQGPLEAQLRARIEDMGLTGRVRLMGFRDDLERILPCLDLVVHPADMEGLGVSLLQAAAAGVPLVGTRVGGVPEIIGDDEAGVLVPPGDAPALSRAVIDLLGDRSALRRLGEAGRRRVAARFSVEAMVAGNLAVYQGLVHG
ncbi:glycosyltransferase family 4 protein [Ectothiorhodospira lacustris]|uniref:glycosyltransferase family 4 protein n=1 Tax=Ectothiorhodospira lacustris TaxID=2899127 RepID=UPI001EE7A8D6|nr:glycosyltransferase family 4 protein [Ectothiorhodospira lacustris]MCG5509918.1 glycosyltransferase family 4 protein [Ectothiorhodospira lacustris]MCG5521172.1 glycosyltransferase family 4 protein [Ectothiorhodospira lacustris]